MRGDNAGHGARKGAVALGVTAGILGLVVRSALGPEHSDMGVPEVVAVSAGVGAGIGALVGATIDAARSRWHVVYQRP